MINDYDNIHIPDNIDSVIDEGVKKALKHKTCKRKFKAKPILLSAAALCLSAILIGAANPELALKVPFVKNVFEYIERNLYFSADYSKYADSIGETISSNGVSITLSEVLCDGNSLYVTYCVKNDSPFKRTSYDNDGSLDMNHLDIAEEYKKVSFSDQELDTTGPSGLEGRFIDEYTFIGVEEYHLNFLDTEIPENFTFKTKINIIADDSTNPDNDINYIYGSWAFEVPIKVDKSLCKVIDVNDDYTNKNIKINSISLTPFTLIADISYTDINWSDYDILFYDDNGNKIDFDFSSIVDNNYEALNSTKNISSYHEIVHAKAPYKDCDSIRIVIKKLINNEPCETVLDKEVLLAN